METKEYLTDFSYEVFLSYAVGTDKTVTEAELGWVTRLHKELKINLEQACPGTRIFFDQNDLPGNVHFESIENAVASSACFLAIVNPLYATRQHCADECRWFGMSPSFAEDKDRVFVVHHRPTLTADLPELLRSRRGFRFYDDKDDSAHRNQPSRPTDDRYVDALKELLGAIESKLVAIKNPSNSTNDSIPLRQGDFVGRRLRSRIANKRSADELLSVVDRAHQFYGEQLKYIKTLCQLADQPSEANVWASQLFGRLANFPPKDNWPVLDDLGAAIREFTVDGFPRSFCGIIGASTHEFVDQLVQNVIASVIEANVERPPRELPEDWYYDFYFRTFAECWEKYKPLFRWINAHLVLDDISAELMAEHVRAQIRLSRDRKA